jgi:hypothetical protein
MIEGGIQHGYIALYILCQIFGNVFGIPCRGTIEYTQGVLIIGTRYGFLGRHVYFVLLAVGGVENVRAVTSLDSAEYLVNQNSGDFSLLCAATSLPLVYGSDRLVDTTGST